MSIKAEYENGMIFVRDIENARYLYSLGYYGKPLNIEKVKDVNEIDSPLILNQYEALYLFEKGIINIYYDKKIEKVEEILNLFKFNDRNKRIYSVYKDLRDKGLIVRSGLKYGAEFVAYRQGPGIDHAPFIIHFHDLYEPLDPIELVRAGRLSHSVKKAFILSTLSQNDVPLYIIFKWFKP